jgi:sulfur-carrier protein adenylyltransferase/sulfurtransferase
MLSAEEQSRYSRHLLMKEVGADGQDKLKASKVLVIGAGGLGCPVLQYLCAAGVGTIGIVDFDVVEESNLQRQILYNVEDLGNKKALTAKKKLSLLNPLVDITAHAYKLSSENALALFAQYDLVVDGSDNFSTRYLINDACVITGKPLVYGALFKFEGQVSVFNFKEGPSYRCLFPEAPEPGTVPNCSESGVLGVLPGIVGALQANEVIKLILGIGVSLSSKLLLIDALTNEQKVLEISKSETEIQKVLASKDKFSTQNYDILCGIDSKDPALNAESTSTQINAQKLKKIMATETVQIIDVRENWEKPKFPELNAVNIPLSEFKQNLKLIQRGLKTVVYCQKGGRSMKAIALLKENGFEQLFNLEGGIEAYQD